MWRRYWLRVSSCLIVGFVMVLLVMILWIRLVFGCMIWWLYLCFCVCGRCWVVICVVLIGFSRMFVV